MSEVKLKGPVWLMQPIPYFGETLREKWIVEPKIDGWRLQIIRYPSGKLEFWGRRLEKNPNWTDKLEFLVETAKKFLPSGTILDSELYSTGGRRLIPSLFGKNPKVAPLIFIFDVIFYQGKFIGNLPLEKRRQILKKFHLEPPFYLIKYSNLKDITEDLLRMIKKGYEGIVVKKLSSLYQLAEDGPMATADWRKIKPGR